MSTVTRSLTNSHVNTENKKGLPIAKRVADEQNETGTKQRRVGLTDISNRNISSLGVNAATKKPATDLKKSSAIVVPNVISAIRHRTLTTAQSVKKLPAKKTVAIRQDENSTEKKELIVAKKTPVREVTISFQLCSLDDPISSKAVDYYIRDKTDAPNNVVDFDLESINEPFAEPHYVNDVFKYYRSCEADFRVKKYMDSQAEISSSMRSILVDWMVEVQENFELNHETLYLAVKMVDMYLSRKEISKTQLQLLGATCVFIACKYDERCPPAIDDFLYICDDAYTREELIRFEMNVLETVQFQLGAPLSYRFLRRYARVAHSSIVQLTLARFILETSLMDYAVVDQDGSKVAAAALLLALHMTKGSWNSTLEYYSGYKESELITLRNHLNSLIKPKDSKTLRTIRTKYSHQIFHEVALIPTL